MKTIKVSGKKILFSNDTISYEEIVELAGKKGDYYIVVFSAKGSDRWTFHQGILHSGESTPVWDNMHIDCCYTGNA